MTHQHTHTGHRWCLLGSACKACAPCMHAAPAPAPGTALERAAPRLPRTAHGTACHGRTHLHAQVGDLRPYLCGFFDTTSGPKVERSSYANIALSLGVDAPSDILFATDMLGEAQAARAAGWQAVLVERPGNKPLPEGHGFRVIASIQDLL